MLNVIKLERLWFRSKLLEKYIRYISTRLSSRALLPQSLSFIVIQASEFYINFKPVSFALSYSNLEE